MVSKRAETPHLEHLDWLLDKTITTLSQTDNAVAIAALVKRAADVSREIDELRGNGVAAASVQSKMDEVRARREKRNKSA